MKTQVIDQNALRTLLARQRQDIKKSICGLEEALEILGVKSAKFYQLLKDPNTLIKTSKTVKSKYIYSSLVKEFERIHGVTYKDAVAA